MGLLGGAAGDRLGRPGGMVCCGLASVALILSAGHEGCAVIQVGDVMKGARRGKGKFKRGEQRPGNKQVWWGPGGPSPRPGGEGGQSGPGQGGSVLPLPPMTSRTWSALPRVLGPGRDALPFPL